ncbi:MAG: hypothetical protein E7575_03305 [Ruminococcaceae bacterium]|nr:hypothetical protein [Oscillospiraceae bacterium]
MVLDKKETSLAYRCPGCGSWVSSIIGIFSLTADMLRLKCPCEKSELTLVHTNDKKLRLTVPCFLCPKPHSFTISQSSFFEKELFSLPCAYSGIDICFFGKAEEVKKAEEEADRELNALAQQLGAENLFCDRSEEDEIFSDPQILEIVNFVIRDLDEAGEIHCKCPDDEGVYNVEVTGDGICVSCEICKAKATVPVTSTITAQAFLNCDSLTLE